VKKWLIGLLVLGLFAFTACEVKAQSLPDNGLTITKEQTTHWQYFKTQTAIGSNPGTDTAFYNPSNGTETASGAINTTAYTQALSIDYILNTLGSTGVDLTIWGRFANSPQWSILHTESIGTSTATIQHIEVEERPEALRVGNQATGVAGIDSIDIWVRGQGWAE
jgi:hypothetical protein